MKQFLLYLFFLPIICVQAQDISFGIGFGPSLRNRTGINTVSDSITVLAQGSRSTINVYTLFFEYQLKKNIQIRSSLNATDHLVGFLLYNSKTTCQFCDVAKSTVIGSFNLNLANSLALRIPFKLPVDFYLLGGVRTNFNFTKSHPDISFRNGERHQGVAEAINNLDDTIKPIYFNSMIGIKSEWKKLSLILEIDKNLNKSITSELNLYGKKYPFRNRTNSFTLSANYKILPWKDTKSREK